jgi:hypothetical protein
MKVIRDKTGGQVQPNDFLPSEDAPNLAQAS